MAGGVERTPRSSASASGTSASAIPPYGGAARRRPSPSVRKQFRSHVLGRNSNGDSWCKIRPTDGRAGTCSSAAQAPFPDRGKARGTSRNRLAGPFVQEVVSVAGSDSSGRAVRVTRPTRNYS